MCNIFKHSCPKNNYIRYRLPSFKSEIYIIKWLPYSETDFHGHKGKECKYMLLKGSQLFEERCKNKLSVITCHKIKPFKVYHINDKIGIHKMINSENINKWSIHKYS